MSGVLFSTLVGVWFTSVLWWFRYVDFPAFWRQAPRPAPIVAQLTGT